MECFKTNIRFTWNTNNNSAAKDKYQKRISRRRNPFKFFFSPFVCSTLGYVHLPNKQKQRSFSNNILYVQNYTYTFVISFIQRKRKKKFYFLCIHTCTEWNLWSFTPGSISSLFFLYTALIWVSVFGICFQNNLTFPLKLIRTCDLQNLS